MPFDLAEFSVEELRSSDRIRDEAKRSTTPTSRFKPANNSRNHPIEKLVGNEVLQGAVHVVTKCTLC
jgi:hypothetical protein